MSGPQLSIIIPTHNRALKLQALLQSLLPGLQGLSSLSYELIVSFDGPAHVLDLPAELEKIVIICEGAHGGPARTRNRGASYARAPLLVFIDDDCVAAPGCLEAYLKAYHEHPRQVLEGRTTTQDIRTSLSEVAPLNESGGFLWSCNFAIPAEIFHALGGFDPRFRYATMEDVELRARILKSGIHIRFLPDATVYHGLRQRGNWEYFKRHLLSEDLYESIHPEMRISTWGHWRMAAYGALFHTIPGIVRFRGRGVWIALREHLFFSIAGARKIIRRPCVRERL